MKKKRLHLLKNQRPKKRSKKKPKKLFFLLLLASFVVGLEVFFKHQDQEHSPTPEQRPLLSTQVIFSIHPSDLNQETQEKIQTLIRTAPSFDTIQANQIALLGNLKRVSIRHIAPNLISIHGEQLLPVARISADSLRLVDDDAIIYSRATEEHQNLPLLTGVVDVEKKLPRHQISHRLEISDSTKERLKKALRLVSLLQKRSVPFTTVGYDPFRGFFIAGSNFHKVTIGEEPFDKKIDHLKTILSDPKYKDAHTLLIELDYTGKAFIKNSPI